MYSVEEIIKVEYKSFKLLVVVFITRQENPSENIVKIKGGSVKECRARYSYRYV